jgi:glycosyltransferase involved in cell wall biosynthesis
MKILVAHNHYLQAGGEDGVFAAEVALLRAHGQEVITWEVSNADIVGNRAAAAVGMVWSRYGYRRMADLLAEHRPDVVHFHNTFMRLSPAVYYACRRAGVPVVQTLHNYRLLCPAATFFRDGHVCEECLGKSIPWPGVRHGCWRRSSLETAPVVGMLTTHNWLGTWQRQVDLFIALTEFARAKYIAGGLPAARIAVKPNFAPGLLATVDPASSPQRPTFALYVGRLSSEKGLLTLLDAWRRVPHIPLKIIGDGPLLDDLRRTVGEPGLAHVELCGRLPHDAVLDLMRQAAFLVFPSAWYECFPLTLLEAMAVGLPVLASNLGAMAEIVAPGATGLLFRPQDGADLAQQAAWAWAHPDDLARMGETARAVYAQRYAPEQNYAQLMAIYGRAIGAAQDAGRLGTKPA